MKLKYLNFFLLWVDYNISTGNTDCCLVCLEQSGPCYNGHGIPYLIVQFIVGMRGPDDTQVYLLVFKIIIEYLAKIIIKCNVINLKKMWNVTHKLLADSHCEILVEMRKCIFMFLIIYPRLRRLKTPRKNSIISDR